MSEYIEDHTTAKWIRPRQMTSRQLGIRLGVEKDALDSAALYRIEFMPDHGERPLFSCRLTEQEIEELATMIGRALGYIIPGGWKLVPIKPTQDMIAAGSWASAGGNFSVGGTGAENAWTKMLEAVPDLPEDNEKDL